MGIMDFLSGGYLWVVGFSRDGQRDLRGPFSARDGEGANAAAEVSRTMLNARIVRLKSSRKYDAMKELGNMGQMQAQGYNPPPLEPLENSEEDDIW